MIVIIDNYDSFVFNLARYFEELGCETRVVRNDVVSVDDLSCETPDAIVISPGPCTPNEAGRSVEIVRELHASVPILGVCLGHQVIATALGASVIRANQPVHGQTSVVQHAGEGIFESIPSPLRATRYHSLIVDESSIPDSIEVIARTDGGIPMAIRHKTLPTIGVQFHPESVLTEHGHAMLRNFLRLIRCPVNDYESREFEPPSSEMEQPVQPDSSQPLHWF